MACAITAFVFLLLAVSVSGSHEIVFTRTQPPSGWVIEDRAASSTRIKFFLALKQQHLDVLESKFWSVSNPLSPEYRQFLSMEEVAQIVAPKPQHVAIVLNWLGSNGVTAEDIITYMDALEVQCRVEVAEKLFRTQFYSFHHAKWGQRVTRQFGPFSIPSSIRVHVDLVMGISTFPIRPIESDSESDSPMRSNSNRIHHAEEPDFGTVPQTIQSLYDIPAQTPGNGTSTTSQGVIEFEGQSFSAKELKEFSHGVGIPVIPLTSNHIIGTNSPQKVDLQPSLDIQFLSTVNTQATNWFWVEQDDTWLYGFTTHFSNTAEVPQVITISWRTWEGGQCSLAAAECTELGVDNAGYVARINSDLQKLGLRGISVLAAAGNSGAHTDSDLSCEAKRLRVDFPASSPFATSVGGTQLNNVTYLKPEPKLCREFGLRCAGGGIESAASFDDCTYNSGGGFSDYSPMPAYQSAAVQAYLSSGVQLPPASYFNTSNRAHPDVAALGQMNMFIGKGAYYVAFGTNAAVPSFAAIVSLLNAASIAKSGKPLGFLNPLLYQIYADNPKAYNDITIGSNLCTRDGCAESCTGFFATRGWDPVTGLGTPNFPVLLQEVQKLGEIQRVSHVDSEQC